MGYDVTMVVAQKGYPSPEFAKDKTKPFDDGSGFENLKDEKGKPVRTGRTSYFCEVIAAIHLCKIDGEISRVSSPTNADREAAKQQFCFFFAPAGDGNTAVSEDKYGDPIRERDINLVIMALEADLKDVANPYRRLPPALALLKSINEHWGNKGDLRVLFYAS